MAWRTATQPPVARSDRWLDGGRLLRPPVEVAVGRADGLAGPSAWAVRQGPSSRGRPPKAVRHGPSARAVYPVETLEPHNY
jgi:hypothetical protein